MAHQEGEPYDLICLDILIPELNGQEVLAEIRRIEKEMGIGGDDGIIMLTVLDDFKDIKLAVRSFHYQTHFKAEIAGDVAQVWFTQNLTLANKFWRNNYA